ncbi:transposase [Mesorhizobium sp. M1307]|uniref:IS110 family transposase n=1 Tax=Mesorhizobium sp. M1307 TaxID=2957079 RepID=UPI003339EA89
MTRKTQPRRKRNLTLVHPNAAAIDIGATILVAAVSPRCDPEPVRTFGTFTADLHRLAAWLEQCGVKTVAMESTGVYWIPLFEILEQHGFDAILVNAREAKQVPGRKSDVSDAEWLQRLHEYGLLRASFRPTGEIATLQSYLRQRERLLDAAATHIQHMQKALTEMNLQLHHVVTDVTGATGLRIMRALVGASAIRTSWPLTVTHIARLQPRLFGRLSSATIGRSMSSLWRKRWSYTRYTKSR